jgi:hypothetical protein
MNRKEAYLAMLMHARKLGMERDAAHEIAMDVTGQTQGVPGELGANPFHRQLGPIRMFSKYPSIWAQMALDFASHPDPAVRRRALAYFTGMPVAAAAAGINALPFLIPRLMIGGAAIGGATDLYHHATGDADHTLGEDLSSPMRYPAKVTKELKDLSRYGFGEHPEFSSSGSPRGSHSAAAGVAGLLGFQTTGKAAQAAVVDDAYDFINKTTQRTTKASGQRRHDLRDALESGDHEAAQALMRQMSPAQLRDFQRRSGKSPYQLLLERVPKADRAEFEQRFKGRFEALK